jgi:hypothetical protein
MRWCLDCHRDPAQYLRPKDQVFNMKYVPPANHYELAEQQVNDEHIKVGQLTNCYICHR